MKKVEVEVKIEHDLYDMAEKEGKKINLTAEQYIAKTIEEYVEKEKNGSVAESGLRR